MARESHRERQGKIALEKAGFLVKKLGDGGWPDQLVLLDYCNHIFLEWKKVGGRLTKAQKRRIPKLRNRGELVAIVTDVEQALGCANNANRILSNSYAAMYELDPLFGTQH